MKLEKKKEKTWKKNKKKEKGENGKIKKKNYLCDLGSQGESIRSNRGQQCIRREKKGRYKK